MRALLLLMAGLLLSSAAQAATLACPPLSGKVAAVYTTHPKSTFQTIFEKLPQDSVTITTVGGPRCVIVRLNFDYVVTIDKTLIIKALLDDRDMLVGVAAVSGFQGGNVGTSSFEWILDNVPDGVHIISFQFRSANGGKVWVYYRTATVLY
jgi:hypothetical protein